MKLSTGWFVWVALLLPAVAFAGTGLDAVKRSVVMGMVVTGDITVNPDGSVHGYSLDQQDKVPADVAKLIGETVPNWKFRPILVDGNAVLAKAGMSLRVVARLNGSGQLEARVEDAEFGTESLDADSPACAAGRCLSVRETVNPRFPRSVMVNGVDATVYVVMKIDKDGHVAAAAVRQVDLRKVADAAQMERWRHDIGDATLHAMRRWTFNVPTTGDLAGKAPWVSTIPMDLVVSTSGWPKPPPGYGQWVTYIPGPTLPLPWDHAEGAAGVASSGTGDGVAGDGAPFVHDTRFVLMTPLRSAAG